MKRFVFVLVVCLGLVGVSYGQRQSRDRSTPVERARAEANAAASRQIEARSGERDAWKGAEKNSASAAAEKNAREASRAARAADKAAYDAGVKYDRAIKDAKRGNN